MRADAETLARIECGGELATLRFFQFQKPTLSYGRLQKRDDVRLLFPTGWDLIQRPTGGGIVLHNGDLCFSLCWKSGQAPLPQRPQDQYRWIHSVVLDELGPGLNPRMAACCDVRAPKDPFSVRSCFTNPVGFDLLKDEKKIVGGALRCTRGATLYQGSLQIPNALALEHPLTLAFQKALS